MSAPDPTPLQDLLRSEAGDPGCDASIAIFDAYVELELAGENPGATYPGTQIHLRACAACRQDHDGLLEAARRLGGADAPPNG
jgi:hypothetical protein